MLYPIIKYSYHQFSIITTTDMNECQEGSHACHQNAVCINVNGSYLCSCKGGYTGNGTTCYGLYDTLNASGIPNTKYHQFFYYYYYRH